MPNKKDNIISILTNSTQKIMAHSVRKRTVLFIFGQDGRIAAMEKQKAAGGAAFNFGDPDWTRTSGLKIRNLALYPPELRDHAGH